MYVTQCILIALLAYTLGSIPFGVVLAKLFRLPDPRKIGSGNIGATNMLRTGNKKVALLTLLLDGGKGAAAVLLTAKLIDAQSSSLCFAALLACIGHMFSVWLKFSGGKGVATILGALLAVSWPLGAGIILVWLIVFLCKQIVSLASVAALCFVPLIAWLRIDSEAAVVLGMAAGIAIWKHRENIRRINRGEEPKIRFSKGEKA